MVLLVALLGLSLPGPSLWAGQRGGSSRCRESCLRHVRARADQSRLCGRCFADADRGGWAARLQDDASIASALRDGDWAVRWGAIRAMAARRGVTETRQLAEYVVKAGSADELTACITAARVAASKGQTTAELLVKGGQSGPAAAARVWKRRSDIRQALELELYGLTRSERAEALRHLATFLSEKPVRVALRAMASRPKESDGIVADLLVELSESGGPPAGALLLEGATPADAPYVDRVLEVYAARIDQHRKALAEGDGLEKREAVAALGHLAPLSAPELESVLADPEPSLRLAAAAALARGERKSVAELAQAKLASNAPDRSKMLWLELLGGSGDRGCQKVLERAASDERLSAALRGHAVAQLGACAKERALSRLEQALEDPRPELRVGAVAALQSIPRSVHAERLAEKALHDSDATVVATALATVAWQRQRVLSRRVAGFLDHPEPALRAAAALALGSIGSSEHVRPLVERLESDASPEVRNAAASSLGSLGGPFVISPLSEAAARDSDASVRHSARTSLHRLGLGR